MSSIENNLYPATRTYCMGWKPIISDDCERMREFEYRSESERKSSPTTGIYRTYTGGGYELRFGLKFYICFIMFSFPIVQKNKNKTIFIQPRLVGRIIEKCKMALSRLKGSIGDLMKTIEILQNNSWLDNRTRAIITEFSVFNAQVGTEARREV